MSGELVVVLALIVAAFAAGWLARGGGDAPVEAVAPAPAAADAAPAAIAAPAASPDARHDAARALTLAAGAYETAVDRWLDERDAITPAGRAAVGELERAVQRLDHAVARLDESGADDALADAAFDALEALRGAAGRLDAFRQGQAMDAAASAELDRADAEIERARAAFA